jgi:hypothetical protein
MNPALQAAANLLFPELGHDVVDPAALDAQAFVRLVERNRVPLAVVRGPQLDALVADPALAEAVDRHRQRLAWWTDHYLEVAKRWAESDIEGVLIKSAGFFPYTSDNIDVLVDHARMPEAIAALTDLGFRECPSLREPYKRYFKRLTDGDDFGLPVHLHSEVAWINRFVPAADVLAQARPLPDGDPLLRGPAPVHVAGIAIAHGVYEDKELKLRDVFHVERASADPAAVRALARDWGWERGLDVGLDLLDQARAVLRGEAEGELPVRISKVQGKAIHLAKTYADPHLGAGARVRETASVLRWAAQVKATGARPPRTVLVSISGPDGAGKTTFARQVQDTLRRAGIKAEYHWQRAGTSPALSLARRAVRLAKPAPEGSGSEDGGTREGAKSPAWSALVAADLGMRLWGGVTSAAARGGVHLFDRFALDGAVDMGLLYGRPAPALQRLRPPVHLSVLVLPPPGGWNGEGAAEEADNDDAAGLYTEQAASFDVVVDGRNRDAAVFDLCRRILDRFDPPRADGVLPERP